MCQRCSLSSAEVSKAFTCLADPHKRAYYDRTGHEDSSAAAAAQRQQGGMGPGMQFQGEMSPEDLFNMMFGGGMGGFGMGPMHFGGFRGHPQFRQRRQHHQQQQEESPQQQDARQRFGGGSAPLSLQRAVQWVTAHPMRAMFVATTLMQMIPLLFAFIGWIWWVGLIGVPAWFVSREVTMFSQRRIYQPLQHIAVCVATVEYLLPYAEWYIGICAPVALVSQQLQRLIVEWSRTLAQ